MLPAFVIGLREGLEAALIVGMVAAFLKQNGRSDALRWVMVGVFLAAGICLAGGVALHELERNLPQKQQEGLETVVAVVAIVMVTYMIVWMRGHARTLKASLEESASHALARGSVFALIGMAFLAVLREGFETAVFLLAVFQSSSNTGSLSAGAVLGIGVAIVIGYGIYRGGVTINLSRFFRFTGLVLVLVAAGLVSSALHTAHEAGWVTWMQGQAVDLKWFIKPGSVVSALVTGMFGIQPKPTTAETAGWLLYLVPVSLYVMWPQRRKSAPPPKQSRDPFPAGSVTAS